jgi:putative ABC transport system permease protein
MVSPSFKPLTVKLGRDLWKQRFQCLAIVAIVACGIASLVTSRCLITTLNTAMGQYYADERFPDFFVKTVPLSLQQANRVEKLPNFSGFQPRLVVDASFYLSNQSHDPLIAKIVSVPKVYEESLNRVIVRQGMSLSEIRKNQVLVSEIFAEVRKVKIGDQLRVTLGGKQVSLEVAGIAIAPEFLFQMRDGAGVPDNQRYAILWMRYDELASAVSMSGYFNSLLVATRTPERSALIKEQISQSLPADATLIVETRSEQLSHRYTTNAINQLYGIAIMPPVIFLSVAAFLIYIAMSRLIKTERQTIAILRSFGYSIFETGQHYALFIVIVVASGCLVGTIVGWILAHKAATVYGSVYRFPSLPVQFDPWALVYSIAAALAAGFLGGGLSVWRAATLAPAIALRPEPPASYHFSWLDRLALWLNLGSLNRMILRGMMRWPVRTGLGILGIALGIGSMVMGSYTQGAVQYVIDFEFFLTRRYDVMVQMKDGTSDSAIGELLRIPGVLACEPFESGKCRVTVGDRERTVTLFGIQENGQLVCPVDDDLKPVPIPPHGVALSSALFRAMQVSHGDLVEVELLNGSKQTVNMRARARTSDYAGLNAFVSFDDFQKWFRDDKSVSGALLQVQTDQLDVVTRMLNQRPKTVAVTVKSKAIENFLETDSKNILLFRFFNMLFSSVIGIGAVYSVASISLFERQRDLALMRVLGYSANETGRVLIGELIVMMVFAIPVGCLSGYLFACLATWMLNTETQRLANLVQPDVYVASAFVSCLVCAISALIIQRRVHSLDCVALLRSKE